MTSRSASKRERLTQKKREEREQRIRAAKRRQRQRLFIVLGVLVAGGVAAAVIAMTSGDEGTVAAGEKCVSSSDTSTADPAGGAYPAPFEMTIDTEKTYSAVIQTSEGDIEVNLHDGIAPMAVNNFVCLARDGFYDGLIFHRVIKDFMIQGGDPAGNGSGGPGYSFPDEFSPEKTFDEPYVLAMANSGPNTNGSQFFITVEPTPQLNHSETAGYVIFGKVVSGTEVAEAISNAAVTDNGSGEMSKPVAPVTIETITITESGSLAAPTESATPATTPSPTPEESAS